MKKNYLILLVLIIFPFFSFATHIVGGSLTYVYNGGSNYTITLKLYRDCGAGTASLPGSVSISILGNNGVPFSPSKDVTINLGTVTNVPSNLSPCAIAPNPLPCVQEAVYTTTVNNLPPNPGGYHLYYQIVARNLSLTNVNAACSCVGESFYAHIPGPNETSIWNENFALPNGTTIDNGTTAWSTLTGSVPPNSAMVNTNLFEIKGANNAQYTWSSQSVNISSCNSVGVTVNLSETGTLDANDSILVYYKLNGGPLTLFPVNGFKADDFTSTIASVSGLVGNTLQIFIRTRFDGNSPNSEIYQIDDVNINCSTGAFLANSNPVFNLFPPLFICVNQPFTFNHAATDANGDSLSYSFYTPYNGDNGIGPLDPTFPSNTASFTPITFLGGYSTTSPLGTPLTLNATTGLLSGTPTIQGQFVVGIMVKEYRNGIYLGQTLRDFQFNVLSCPQPPPAITVTDISINNGCVKPLVASGITSASTTWHSIYPGASGAYNNYLSCTSGCLTPTVTVIGTPPPYIDYIVCGNSISCAGTYVCDTVRVNFNQTLAVSILPSNPTLCFGQTSTTLTAIGLGGTPPYSYLWNNVNAVQNIFVGVGTYNVKVTDASGCPPAYNSIIVTSYSVPISANAGADKTVCVQNPMAIINATVVGAIGGIWSGGNGTFSPNNITLTNLNYTPSASELSIGSATLFLTTTGNGNCPLDVDTLVIYYSNFTATATTTVNAISCFGGTNGSASLNLTGGIGPFVYSWTTVPIQTTPSVSNLALGIYSSSVTDGIGCTYQTTVTITQPTPLNVVFTSTNVSCQGGSNGIVQAFVVGGTSPYGYSWLNNGQTGSGLNNISAGIYTLVVTDAKGCSLTKTVTVTEPSILNVALTATNVSCFSGTTGIINSTVSGGTLGYTYSWSPTGSSATNLNNVVAGNYTLTVTDSKGCVSSKTTTITQSTPLLAAISVTNETCNYLNNGIVTVSASGGTAGYTYLWQPGSQTSNTINNLSSGVYSVTVTDVKGCTTTTIATISEPTALGVNISSQINVSCFGGTNGTASASGTGGTPNYSYTWSPGGSTNAMLTGMSAGTYTVLVSDNKSCQTQTTVTITQPTPLNVVFTSTNVSCQGGSNGIVQAFVVGGTSPYGYSWLNNGQTGSGLNNISAGIYTLVVTDAKGCSLTKTVTVTEPSILNVALTATNVSCFSGTTGIINSTVSGGTLGYTYSWSPTGSSATNLNNVVAGNYTLTVTDSKGCVSSKTTTITQSTPLLAAISVTNETCNYLNNGIVTVSASGGTAGCTYLWQPGSQTSNTINNLSSGVYSVTVTDVKGCTTTTIATISEPTALGVNISSQINVSCFGGTNGTASASGTGGTPNYSYTWSPGGSTNAMLTGMSAGTYTVLVSDNKSCQTQTTVTITQPNILNVSTGITNVACNGGNNGVIAISPSGGTAPYINTLFPGNIISSNFSSLSPGTYTIMTLDGNNCSNTTTVNINQPISISSAIGFTNSNCGLQNGKASISITSGGVAPFTYQWLPSGGTNSVSTSLFAGSYTVNVFDNNGCLASNIININDLEGPTVSILSTTNVSCFGGSNGSATATFTGGAGPGYTYVWLPSGGNSLTANNLTIGNYVIKVTDNSGCIGLATTSLITQPTLITTAITSTAVSCFGGSNGSAQATVNGGTPGYTYQWLPSGTTANTIAGLTSGNYTLQVKDSYSCTQTSTFAIAQPTSAVSSSIVSSSVSCFGGSNGSATVTVSGGTSPYSYLWNYGSVSGNVLSNVPAGNYSVTIADFKGCNTTVTVTIIEPAILSLSIGSINSNCSLANGQASVTVTGGVGLYQYLWTPSGSNNQITTGLLAGTYSVLVHDGNNCSATNSVIVLDNPSPTSNVSAIGNVTCYGGSNGTATVSVIGGTGPFTYSWSPIGGTTSVGNNLTIGTYTVKVSSSNGCTVSAVSSLITEPLPVITSITSTVVSCFGGSNGSAQATVNGGTPAYTYQWLPSGTTANTISGLTSGNYTLQVKDSYSCTQTSTFAIAQPSLLTVNVSSLTNVSCFNGNNGSATVSVNGGTAPMNYNWIPNGGNGAIASALTSGNYSVTITDINGCNTNTVLSITQPSLALSATGFGNATLCFGFSNGTASVSVVGGTPNYTYQWSPLGGSSNVATGLPNGNYFVTINDLKNCQTIVPISIAQAIPITATLIPHNASCGLPNGFITPQINGGTGPYAYSWNSGLSNTIVLTNIAGGSYSLQIIDNNNCIATFSTSIINLPVPSIGIISTNSVSCFGGNNGVATATVNNVALPYTMNWLPAGGNALSATNLTVGNYTAQLTDANGCLASANTTINEPVLLSISSVSVTDVLCFGQNSGAVSIQVIGGSSVYSYSWSPNNASASTAANLSSGNYTVLVTDNNNCNASTSVFVNQPTVLTTTINGISNSICYNTTGSSTVNVSGGTMPYAYYWSSVPSQSGSIASNLVAGNYTFQATDAKGCTASNTIAITEPSQIITSVGVNDTICVGQQATITSTAIGGLGNYYYTWMPSGAINTGTLNSSPLSNTTYTVVAFDQNGCAGIDAQVKVIVYNLANANVQVVGQTPICPGQASLISAQVFGNTGPVSLSWNNGLGNGTGPYIVHPAQPTTYVLTVNSSCGIIIKDSVTVLLNPQPTLVFSSDTINSCAPGIINFTDNSIAGNTADPITSWNWNFGDGTVSTSENPSHIYNSSGTFTVNLTVTTDAGCTSNSSLNPIIIHTFPTPIASFSVNSTSLDLPYDVLHCTNLSSGATSYVWDFGDATGSTMTDPNHLYQTIEQFQIQLVAINQYGCKDTATSEVITHADIVFPNAFTPNPDGSSGGSYNIASLDNDVFFPYTSGVVDFKLQIFDRWGELIFESTDIKTCWDGYYKGKLCQLGVYIWKAYVKLNNGKEFNKTGDVTLLR